MQIWFIGKMYKCSAVFNKQGQFKKLNTTNVVSPNSKHNATFNLLQSFKLFNPLIKLEVSSSTPDATKGLIS